MPATLRDRDRVPFARNAIQGDLTDTLLEPELADKVHSPPKVRLARNAAKARRIKVLRAKREVRMIQDIDGRSLDLKSDCFRDRDPLGNA